MKKFISALGCLLFCALPAKATTICASVPYTFVNGTTANATQVNANFTTILNCFNTGTAANGANGDITSLSALTSLTDSGPGSFGSITVSGDTTATGTGQSQLPQGTSAQRSGSPVAGMVRFNTTFSMFEGYDGTNWVPLGAATASVAMFAGGSCPNGWIKNNGQTISRTTFAALFNIIGTTYGAGNGTTTFNVPNDQGYFWRAVNTTGGGIDPGRVLGSTQADQLQAHTHALNSTSTTAAGGGGQAVATPTGSGLSTGAVNTGNVGSETRPQNIAYLSCIHA